MRLDSPSSTCDESDASGLSSFITITLPQHYGVGVVITLKEAE